MMAEDTLKVGVWQGGGPPPGYKHHVWVPSIAYTEARRFLDQVQYAHAADLMKDLAGHDDPTHSVTQRVESLGGEIHELKDKGGILRKINLRVFFHVDKRNAAIVVLGAINKNNEDQLPKPIRLKMGRRLRKYLSGQWELPQH